MKIEKIKPIPKYIEKKIISMDKKRNLTYNQKRFYAYFTTTTSCLSKIKAGIEINLGFYVVLHHKFCLVNNS